MMPSGQNDVGPTTRGEGNSTTSNIPASNVKDGATERVQKHKSSSGTLISSTELLALALCAVCTGMLMTQYTSEGSFPEYLEFRSWSHFHGWLKGELTLDNRIIVDPARWSVKLTREDIEQHRLTPQTIERIRSTMMDTGIAVLTGGSIWTDKQLKEMDDLMYGELELNKKAAEERGIERSPWNLHEWYGRWDTEELWDEDYEIRWRELAEEGVPEDEIEEKLKTDYYLWPQENHSWADSVSISVGRIDMPHFLNFTMFQQPEYFNRSDFIDLCESLIPNQREGLKCETILSGALWNFPGSFSSLWHQDVGEGDDEEKGCITTAIATRQLPANVGWVRFQPLTCQECEYGHIPKDRPSEEGEPYELELPLNRGDMLFFTDTTKHTVTPNPTLVDRGIVYILYGRQRWEDTEWHSHEPLVPDHMRGKEWNPIMDRKELAQK